MLDHPILSQRYFFPHPGRPSRGAWEVTTDDGHCLVCFREVHPANHFTVVYYHGNGETVADHLPSPAHQWLALGVNLVIVSYRGYGDSGGTPQLARMLSDVQPVFASLATPASRLVVFGRSLGSLYATEFVHRYPQVAGLILESGIADPLERVLLRALPDELGGTAPELRAHVDQHLNQQRKLAGYPGPILVMHALGDSLVDASHAQRNHDWSTGEKRLVLFDRGDHNTILAANQQRYFQEVADFLQRCRKPDCEE